MPGPDWLMVIRGATEGRRHGAITGLGTQAGLLAHGLLATVGISAILAAAPQVLIAVQVVGALYLLYFLHRTCLPTSESMSHWCTRTGVTGLSSECV
ncbi:LysE family transporter [Rhodococcus sp. G-MC3]|uniref:LysE family translocator n=1 Tax=Rhodococcus sp. G-MC3 TaxID=3046209 RepID=UPI0024BB9494|nr:LysE family transporter [Rhodococcus sp. G-MC3]MDJ0394307.1 LysE family transporter [Rhodococcus sp. G-MC3]